MKKAFAVVAAVVVVLGAAGTMLAQEKKVEAPKAPVVFETKMGAVSFDHTKHLAAVGGDCKACHPALFKQEKAPTGFTAPHSKVEAEKKSCGACHAPGGKAFETKGNCAKCHVKKAAA